jgi:hypothetical protein
MNAQTRVYDPMTETVLTAFAESASGPGWANSPIWVVVRKNGTSEYMVRCIQPGEQTEEMITLYTISQAAHLAMKKAVRR